MFQKAAHDADDPDIFRLSRHAGQQAADAADHQVDLHALLRGQNQPVDDGLVGKRVDFYADIGRLALSGTGDLPVDQRQYPVLQAFGRHQQLLGVLHGLAHGQSLKYCGGLHSDSRVRRHQGQVCVKPRRLLVVVAGADLGVILGLPIGPAGDETQLAVDLIAVQPIDDLAAGLLQTAGPFDVVLLVKAGFQLHQHQNVFAVFRRLDQAFHNLAVPGYPVKGHFDGHHVGVACCLLKEIQKGLHALKGIGEQLVPLFDLGHYSAVGTKLS